MGKKDSGFDFPAIISQRRLVKSRRGWISQAGCRSVSMMEARQIRELANEAEYHVGRGNCPAAANSLRLAGQYLGEATSEVFHCAEIGGFMSREAGRRLVAKMIGDVHRAEDAVGRCGGR